MATPPVLSKRDVVLSFVGLCLLNLVASLDTAALSVVLPTIAEKLHATTIQAYWAGTGFVVASAVCQPIFAAFSNAFGRKPMILVALSLFAVGTVLCGTAHNIAQMLVGRVIQGAGGGGLLTLTYAVIVDLLPLKDRGKGMSVISLVWLFGTVSGPIMGGGFGSAGAWRWVFWFVLPFVGIGLVLNLLFLKTPHAGVAPLEALKQVDWNGAVLFVCSLTSFLVALSWGGSMFSWTSWHTLVPLVFGALGICGWVAFEYLVPKHPILPLVILNNRTAMISYLGTFCLGIVQFGLFYYLPLYYQVSKGYSPLISGVALLPQCVTSGFASAVTGQAIARTGRYKPIAVGGWAIMVLGCGLLIVLDTHTTIAQFIFLNVPSGIGLGMIFIAQPMAAQAATANQHMAIAAGLSPFFRAIGQSLGIVLGGTVFQNALRTRLMRSALAVLRANATELAEDAASLRIIIDSEPGEVKAEVIRVFDESTHMIWWCLLAFSAAAGMLSLAMREISLNRPAAAAAPEKGSAEEVIAGADVTQVAVIQSAEKKSEEDVV